MLCCVFELELDKINLEVTKRTNPRYLTYVKCTTCSEFTYGRNLHISEGRKKWIKLLGTCENTKPVPGGWRGMCGKSPPISPGKEMGY